MQKRTMELRSPERRQFDNRDWASPVSSNLDRSNILPVQASSNNPFNDMSKNLTESHEVTEMQHRRDNINNFRGHLDSQLQKTTNFSDVLASRVGPNTMDLPTMQREEIGTDREMRAAAPDSLDKLDELEQMALEALDDI